MVGQEMVSTKARNLQSLVLRCNVQQLDYLEAPRCSVTGETILQDADGAAGNPERLSSTSAHPTAGVYA
jgi:hypothetical protein